MANYTNVDGTVVKLTSSGITNASYAAHDATSKAYEIDDTVLQTSKIYRCKLDHTSAATNAPGAADGDTYWEEVPLGYLEGMRSISWSETTNEVDASPLNFQYDLQSISSARGTVAYNVAKVSSAGAGFSGVVQEKLTEGSTFGCEILVGGIKTGNPKVNLQLQIAGGGGDLNRGGGAFMLTRNIVVQGAITYGTQ